MLLLEIPREIFNDIFHYSGINDSLIIQLSCKNLRRKYLYYRNVLINRVLQYENGRIIFYKLIKQLKYSEKIILDKNHKYGDITYNKKCEICHSNSFRYLINISNNNKNLLCKYNSQYKCKRFMYKCNKCKHYICHKYSYMCRKCRIIICYGCINLSKSNNHKHHCMCYKCYNMPLDRNKELLV